MNVAVSQKKTKNKKKTKKINLTTHSGVSFNLVVYYVKLKPLF